MDFQPTVRNKSITNTDNDCLGWDMLYSTAYCYGYNLHVSHNFSEAFNALNFYQWSKHSVMCSVTGAWVQADVFGLRPRLVFGGGTLHIMDACL